MITMSELQRLDRTRPWLLDTGLAVGLLAATIGAGVGSGTVPPGWVIALFAVVAATFCFRRAAPLPVLLISGSVVGILVVLGHDTAVVGSALFLAAYTVAARSGTRATVAAALFCLTVLAVLAVAAPELMGVREVATNLALFVGSFALGRATHAHREAVRLEAERAELARVAQSEQIRAAATEERLRIARELHDVVGHSLGVIALQAGVGARVAVTEPEEARAALLAIAERSRESLAEVRQLLGALRIPAGEPEPPYGPDDLDRLTAQAATAGVAVETTRQGDPWPVGPTLASTIYRVVQESLTNVVRHSHAKRAEIVLRFTADRLFLTVCDDGRGAPPGATPGGGQTGIRERVAAWDGELHCGNRAEGGYEVVASIPRPREDRT